MGEVQEKTKEKLSLHLKKQVEGENKPGNRMSGRLQGTAVDLERRMKQHTLKKKLATRPSKKSLEKSLILKDLNNLAPSLQANALVLEKNLSKSKLSLFLNSGEKVGEVQMDDNLRSLLSARPSKKDLENKQILKQPNTADNLQGRLKVLEIKFKANTLRKKLDSRPSKKDLARQLVLKDFKGELASSLQGTASELEKNLAKSKIGLFLKTGEKVAEVVINEGLSDMLSKRPTMEELEEKKILNPLKTDARLQGRATQLDKQFKQNTLKKKLSMRPTQEELKKNSILKDMGNLAPSLQANALILEKNLSKNKLNVFLKTGEKIGELDMDANLEDLIAKRPSKKELEGQQILKQPSTADNLQGRLRVLELKFKAATLRKKLSLRPSKKDLERKLVLKDFKGELAPSLQGTASELEKNITKSKVGLFLKSGEKVAEVVVNQSLSEMLNNRPTMEELEEKKILNPLKADARLQGRATQLDKQFKQNTLKKKLSMRPTQEELKKNSILKDMGNLAPSLQANALILEKNLSKNKLNVFLKTGEKVGELDMDANLEDLIAKRPSKKELEGQQILKQPSTADNLQGRLRVLELKFKAATLRKKLSLRPSKKELERQLVLKDFKGELAPSLQGTATELEKNITKSKVGLFLKSGEKVAEVVVNKSLEEMLKKRPNKEELEEQKILNLKKTDARLQGRATQLEKQFKQNTLKKKLSLRPSKKELAQKKILREFINDLAPSLQKNAIILEKSLVKDKLGVFLRTGEKLGEISVGAKLQKLLESRPERKEIATSDVPKSAQVADTISGTKRVLALKFKQSVLQRQLSMRSSKKDLEKRDILPQDTTSHSLQPTKKTLAMKLKQNTLKRQLSVRSSKDELESKDILKSNASDSLQGTQSTLAMKFKQNTLKKQLSKRKSRKDLASSGILVDMNELELDTDMFEQKETSSETPKEPKRMVEVFFETGEKIGEIEIDENLVSLIQSRPPKEELINRDILVKQQIAPILQGTATDLEKNLRQSMVKQKLTKRPSRGALKKQQVVKDFADKLAPALQSNASELEAKMKKDNVLQGLSGQDRAQAAEQKAMEAKGLEFI